MECRELNLREFKKRDLSSGDIKQIQELARVARGDILKMTTIAGSGHPGGSLSSIDIYLILWLCAMVDPEDPSAPERDRIVVSHGHTAAAVYAALGRTGFFDIDQALATFRRMGSIYEGHIENRVPGIDWTSGNLGQGLSVGCGFALASRYLRYKSHVFVVMGDGEQQKGEISEAQRFAVKYKLNNLTIIIDNNGVQASGAIKDVMPQNFAQVYAVNGWKVREINGHDHREIYHALRLCHRKRENPTLILAHTIMGKGISFMENQGKYHGSVLNVKKCKEGLAELGLSTDMKFDPGIRNGSKTKKLKPLNESLSRKSEVIERKVNIGTPRIHGPGTVMDNRSAFGQALLDIAEANIHSGKVPLVVLDCDLMASVKIKQFALKYPANFIQGGIQEHNTATIAGALSKCGILTFFADFGVFGIDETYNQQRLNDINGTSLKLICTHNGLEVGEDGKTHQCIDYLGIISNLFGYKVIIPADANQTDRTTRYIASTPGNFLLAMGRSKYPILLSGDGNPLFDKNYEFEYGRADWIRNGTDAAIITYGSMVHYAVKAWSKLKTRGYNVAILNLSCPLSIDEEKVLCAARTKIVVTYEDHNIRTGIGAIIGTFLAEKQIHCRFKRIGITNYGGSAGPEELYKSQEMDEDSLVDIIVREIRASK